MGDLAEQVRRSVRREEYVFSIHADERLRERRIMGWQVLAGMDAARALREAPEDSPHPTAEFELVLADGTACKAVWAWIAAAGVAKLVTVHFFDR